MYIASRLIAVALLSLSLFPIGRAETSTAMVQELRVLRSSLSTGENTTDQPIVSTTFQLKDHINYFTEVDWRDSSPSAGSHHLEYKFFTGDKQIFAFDGQKDFVHRPYSWSAWVSGHHLGTGHHRAELWIDGLKMDEQELNITTGETTKNTASTLQSDLAIRDTLRQQAGQLLVQERLDEFDRLATQFRVSKERSPAGLWMLGVLYDGIRFATPDQADSPQWSALDEMAERWLARTPESPAAIIVAAQLKLLRAWKYRGDDGARSISPEGMAQFLEYVDKARVILETHQEMSMQDPEWARLRVQVASWQGEPKQTILAIADAALQREPGYYPLHYAMATAMHPKWGGSEEMIKQYVQLALERSKTQEGTQVYARIYLNLTRSSRDISDELNMTGAKWPAMRQSLDEILKTYPDPWNIDAAQAMACIAGVPDYYQSLGRWADRRTQSIGWFDTTEYRRDCDAHLVDGKTIESTISRRAYLYLSYLRGFGNDFWRLASVLIIGITILLELALRYGRRQGRVPADIEFYLHGNPGQFQTRRYPHTYKPLYTAIIMSAANAVRALVYGPTIVVMFALAPSPANTETLMIQGTFILVSMLGVAVIFYQLSRRVRLTADAIEVIEFNTRKMRREEIASCTAVSEFQGEYILLTPRQTYITPLKVPPPEADDEWAWSWFSSLPQDTR